MDININNREMINFLHPECDGKRYNREDYIYDHSINEIRKEEYISLFKDDVKDNIKYILDKVIKHISWNEFKNNLLKVAKETVDILGDNDFQFVIPANKNKSNYFFTAIVNEEVFIPNNKKALLMCNTIVNVDDMSYSGSQLLDLLKKNFTIKLLAKDKDIINVMKMSFKKFLVDFNSIKNNQQSILNPNEYTLLTDGNEILFITKDKILKYSLTPDNIFTILELSESLKYVKNVYQQQEVYINLDKLPNKKITIILCIPYISQNAFEKLKKFHDTYSIGIRSSVNIIFPKSITIVPNLKRDSFIEEIYDSFFRYNSDWYNMTAVYFDHKLASPVSTVSVILGCGIVPKDLSISDKNESIGNLLNNCSKEYVINEDILTFKSKFYKEDYRDDPEDYDPKVDESSCINCPKPVYKYEECDFKNLETAKELKNMGFCFTGLVGKDTILIEE